MTRGGDSHEGEGSSGLHEAIRERAELLRSLRRFFDDRGFLEVQPPCLLPDCVVDAFIDPIRVDPCELRLGGGVGSPRLFLQSSPELAMKQMLADGAPSIYSIGPVFRAAESGPWHRTEFTMLEWYEVGGDERSAVEMLSELASSTLHGLPVDVCTYRELFVRRLGFDPIEAPLSELARHVAAISPQLAGRLRDDRDGMLDVMLSERLQPEMGSERPLIVSGYPLSQAALAKGSAADPQTACRFELFYRGVELANGYDELLDPDEVARRSAENDRRRVSTGRAALRAGSTLIEAMRKGLPPCAGVALGVDRLQMVKSERADLRGCGFDGLHLNG